MTVNITAENLFTQFAQEVDRQINQLTQERNNAQQERDARPTQEQLDNAINERDARPTQQDLDNEREARNRSRERREQEFNERLESDREVLRDRLGEETAYVVQNQEAYWRNTR
jgi:hypothetical protein